MDARGGELDEALVEVALTRLGGAHPGRLEQLVGEKDVAPLVGRQRLAQRGPPTGGGQWPVGLGAAPLNDRAARRAQR